MKNNIDTLIQDAITIFGGEITEDNRKQEAHMATVTAEILSCEDSGRKWNEKVIWSVEADGKQYTTFTDMTKEVGNKVTYEEIADEYPKGSGKIQYKMKYQAAGSKPFGGGFKGGHKSDPNTMVLAYAKDLAIAMTVAGFVKNATDMQKWVADNYTFMSGLLPKDVK